MRYPRLSARAKHTYGFSGKPVVLTGAGWDNVSVPRHRRRAHHRSDTLDVAARDAQHSRTYRQLWAAWENAEPGPDKRTALENLRRFANRHGFDVPRRKEHSTPVQLDYMGETWANKR